MREMTTLYAAFLQSFPSTPPPLPAQGDDYHGSQQEPTKPTKPTKPTEEYTSLTCSKEYVRHSSEFSSKLPRKSPNGQACSGFMPSEADGQGKVHVDPTILVGHLARPEYIAKKRGPNTIQACTAGIARQSFAKTNLACADFGNG
jgi:hypothetical protein